LGDNPTPALAAGTGVGSCDPTYETRKPVGWVTTQHPPVPPAPVLGLAVRTNDRAAGPC